MKIIKLIGKYMVMYLSCFMPRKKNIWVFGAWLGMQFSDNTKYLFLEANTMEGIRPVWITKNPRVAREIKRLGYEVHMDRSIQGIWCQLRAKYAFVCNGISDLNHTFLGKAVFINVWHGVPLKKVGYDDTKTVNWNSTGEKLHRKIRSVPLGNEYVVATSSSYAKIYESAFGRPTDSILVLGQPRNDLFYDQAKQFPRNLRLEDMLSGKKVILYAPTHRREGQEPLELSQHFDWKRVNDFCEKHQCLFLIRKHFYHRDETLDLLDFPYILDVTRKYLDLQELLLHTDLLITDYSSVYIDYLLLNRPIVFYYYDYDHYLEEDREMYYDYETVTPGPKVQSFDDLLVSLEETISGGDHYQKEREQVRDLFYCQDGQGPVGKQLLDMVLNDISS